MTRKPRKPRPQMPEHFIFEITDFEPVYMLSVNHQRDAAEPWWEHSSVVLETVCLHPKKVASRPARFDVVAERNFWIPSAWHRDHDWRPRAVGLLDLPPGSGRFYTSIPHESMGILLTSLTTGHYRYVLLFGPPLSCGKSLCQSIHFQRTVDLADY